MHTYGRVASRQWQERVGLDRDPRAHITKKRRVLRETEEGLKKYAAVAAYDVASHTRKEAVTEQLEGMVHEAAEVTKSSNSKRLGPSRPPAASRTAVVSKTPASTSKSPVPATGPDTAFPISIHVTSISHQKGRSHRESTAIREAGTSTAQATSHDQKSLEHAAPTTADDAIATNEGANGLNTTTPPSSPPQMPLKVTPPPMPVRKPSAGFLKRKRKGADTAQANGDTNANGTGHEEDSFDSGSAHKRARHTPESNSDASKTVRQTSTNGRTSSPPTANGKRPPGRPPRHQLAAPLKQTQLSLGTSIVKTCAGCGMPYVPSDKEDIEAHNRFHLRDIEGIEVSQAFLRKNRWVYQSVRHPERCVVIAAARNSPSLVARKGAENALEVAERDLGAPPFIDRRELWMKVSPPEHRRSQDDDLQPPDRYKVFMLIEDKRCIGLCLAERIWEAHRVETQQPLSHNVSSNTTPLTPQSSPSNQNAVDISDTAKQKRQKRQHPNTSQPSSPLGFADREMEGQEKQQLQQQQHRSSQLSSSLIMSSIIESATVGISRIWTSAAYRRKGVAMELLECVRDHFVYGVQLEPKEIAFTPPTESGCHLLAAFYREHGQDDRSAWRLYGESPWEGGDKEKKYQEIKEKKEEREKNKNN